MDFAKSYSNADEAMNVLLDNYKNPKVETKEVEKIIEKEIEKEVIKEIVKEVPVALKDNQVVFTFLPDVQLNARKVRPFMIKDKIINATTPSDQLDDFLNYSAKYFMRHKYDNIINPL